MKSALIMNMPKCCWVCKLARKTEDNDWDRVCCPAGVYMDFSPSMMVERPEWCPLRKLPEKHNDDGRQMGEEWAVFNKGWNACLDNILGN